MEGRKRHAMRDFLEEGIASVQTAPQRYERASPGRADVPVGDALMGTSRGPGALRAAFLETWLLPPPVLDFRYLRLVSRIPSWWILFR